MIIHFLVSGGYSYTICRMNYSVPWTEEGETVTVIGKAKQGECFFSAAADWQLNGQYF